MCKIVDSSSADKKLLLHSIKKNSTLRSTSLQIVITFCPMLSNIESKQKKNPISPFSFHVKNKQSLI